MSMIEVSDNGKGVEEHDFEGLTLKHHTSKIQDFGDLVGVKTFGFRGEALSSLCALSDLVVTTRHSSQSVGTKLTYDHNGKLCSKIPCPRQVGTTVTLQSLFSTLPVRHKEFQRNIKKEFTKMVQVLNSYCLISTGVRISCTNQCDKGKKTIVLSTNGHPTIKENISSVFGAKQASSLLEFQQETASDDILSEYGLQLSSDDVKGNVLFTLEGYISSCEHGQGRSASDRQFYFINSRPCDPSRVMKVVNEVYHQYNRHQYPCVVLNIRLKEDDVDINVTPDKRQILVNNEKILLATVKTSMIRIYGNIPSSLKAQNTSLNNSFSSLDKTPVRSSVGSPAIGRVSALTQRFGRKSESSPSSDFSPSQSSPLSVFGLKRSFSSSSCTDNSPTSKQPKLESFLTKMKSDPGSSKETEEESEQDSVSLCEAKNEMSMNEKVNGNAIMEESVNANIKTAITEALDNETALEKDNLIDTDVSVNHEVNGDVNDILINEEHDTNSVTIQEENRDPQLSNGTLTNMPSPPKGSVVKSALSKFSASSSSSVLSPSCRKAHSATDNFLNNLIAKKTKNKFVTEPSSPHTVESKPEPVDDFSLEAEVKEEDSADDGAYSESPSKENETKGKIIVCEEYDPRDFTATRKSKKVSFDIEKIKEKLNKSAEDDAANDLIRKFRAKITPGENSSAEDELRKEISKDMFEKMEILGQFNLGFIITRLGSDLFIIDQHATDEKYNFETLQATCTLKNQRLINPRPLELTAANESVLLDNLEIFNKNGFEFKIDEEKPVGQRVNLVSMPVSRGWEFGSDDIDELIFMLSDSPGVMCRPTRVRAMFASRACRKSVMIGTALTKAQMKNLVCHMAEIEQPWNCPHGRPTMRHLINLDMIASQDELS